MTSAAVSLLVHSHPELVAEQVRNINCALAPDAIVVHVSRAARFAPIDLDRSLRNSGIPVAINPVQQETQWGAVIAGHRANLLRMTSLGIPEQTPTVFHASNDWYLRPVVGDPLTDRPFAYQSRPANADCTSMWAQGAHLAYVEKWSRFLGASPVLSQIEGCWYPLGFARDTLDQAQEIFPGRQSVPQEEFLLSTAAACSGLGARDTPLIFSEVLRAEAQFAGWARRIHGARLPSSLQLLLRKFVSRRSTMWQLTAADLETVSTGHVPDRLERIREGACNWSAYDGTPPVGVKRMPLDPNSPIRRFAVALASRHGL